MLRIANSTFEGTFRLNNVEDSKGVQDDADSVKVNRDNISRCKYSYFFFISSQLIKLLKVVHYVTIIEYRRYALPGKRQ